MTRMSRAVSSVALSLCITAFATLSSASEHKVLSLDWPPYVGESLPHGGVLIEVLDAALAERGDALSVEFLPWARSQKQAKEDSSVLGYYPAWPSEVQEGFFASPVIYSSPVGFVQRSANPITWNSLEDLHGMTVIVVRAYEYPPEFTELMNSGNVTVFEASDDKHLIKMVAGGRGDIGVIDKFVMSSLLNDPELSAVKDNVSYNEKHLVQYPLVVAMRDTPENRALATDLDRVLEGMDIESVVSGALGN